MKKFWNRKLIIYFYSFQEFQLVSFRAMQIMTNNIQFNTCVNNEFFVLSANYPVEVVEKIPKEINTGVSTSKRNVIS